MKYKIYKLVTDSFNDDGAIKRLIQDEEFGYHQYDTLEEAYNDIKRSGIRHCNYTILPHINVEDW